jgi:hypothetical protein
MAGKKGVKIHSWTQEQIDFLRHNYPKMPISELTDSFNNKFCVSLSKERIKGAMSRHKIRSGRNGCFSKGQTPWNLGKTGYMGANATSFKRGNVPHNKRHLWAERLGKDGYIEMNVPETNPYTGYPMRYKHKHRWLWECENGPVPKGHAVIFKDGNIRNFNSENLILVSRTELLIMNLHGYKNMPDEIKPTVLALAKLEADAGFRTMPSRGRS